MGRRLFAVLSVALLAIGAGLYWLLSSHVVTPPLTGDFTRGLIRHDDKDRRYGVYQPQVQLAPAPLIMVLHGSMGDGDEIRQQSQFGFDRLADREGFVTVYPDGFESHWNDCRKAADYSAREQGVDDLGFLQTLVEKLVEERRVDPGRVYLVGYSNGGHLAFRAAMETPHWMQGIAAIAANLPARDNNACEHGDQPMATLLINGTEDPINPYEGGQVTLFGFGDRGDVLPSTATLAYFADPGPGPITPLDPDHLSRQQRGQALIERWQLPGKPLLELVTLQGGGHTVPVAEGRMPRLLGTTSHDIDTAEQAWRFFRDARAAEAGTGP
ncbi:MAG: PHB depolymerase family esterase [Oleiphilaceae bacterium]|nr:PHB depolymerase family esterase [Oleiphilaceae bacterium]